MLTAYGSTAMLDYGTLRHKFEFLHDIGETSIKRCGNALRVYWKYTTDGPCAPWRDGFDIAIDDIGIDGATLHPVIICECEDHDHDE